ncbi:nitrite/sulfite reductase [Xanthobacter tagetidis]|jgi:sulfite reductase (NADPH) hemoprotein beta-component|uniref:Nitrite/sulfite reductase n=1 Tax=Xanthobacter tagetidis TaxID=60216 RepID=A0A3L7AI85_9HYPH|nr:nitrite/sulfite reductase [Xanthobacter tagetidis]MBB6306431.1 sulfite reductase (NADPH) hemoprotein beta-component [Xanthobacter tagetidis]RLP79685.1 nitrite/sulfite reductase [Xanthobacter tagetidis]
MYVHDEFDRAFLAERVEDFRGQVARRLSGALNEEEFKPLRLMNGVYLQLHAYMLRVCIPYGTLSATQLRALAAVARKYDRGYGHFTTRQNIQFNWIKLAELPDAMADLAKVGIHGIQTSGNCIRNTTTDPWAGAAPDEIEDPRLYAEIIRQWSTLHPEFTFLPRKFKIAITAATHDRAAIKVHDIGLRLHRRDGETGFEVIVGGGLGRSPFIGKTIRDFLPKQHLLSYLEAVLRTYNLEGRRDNIYKARIKIQVHEIGLEEFTRRVEAEWEAIREGTLRLDEEAIDQVRAHFATPAFDALEDGPAALAAALQDPGFALWHANVVAPHKAPGHAIVTLSLKPIGGPPGDATADQMDAIAELAELYAYGEVRVAHEQNLTFPHVRQKDLPELWRRLDAIGVATPNVGLVSDIISCPGLDYCSLANTRSIPIAQAISERFADGARAAEIGRLHLNISGCINACGHHHIGHIGILGVDKKDEEFFQIVLGGKGNFKARLGELIGPAIPESEIVDAVERIVDTYLELRTSPSETFIAAVERLGLDPFKERAYASR